MGRWLLEQLWPPLRWERHCREEDAECRRWYADNIVAWRKRESEEALERFHKPLLFTEFING